MIFWIFLNKGTHCKETLSHPTYISANLVQAWTHIAKTLSIATCCSKTTIKFIMYASVVRHM